MVKGGLPPSRFGGERYGTRGGNNDAPKCCLVMARYEMLKTLTAEVDNYYVLLQEKEVLMAMHTLVYPASIPQCLASPT